MKKPLVLTPQATQISYCVPIPLKVFRDRCTHSTYGRTSKYLHDNTPEGINSVEFNGHFGSNIFFNAENDAARDAFVKVIHDCLTMPKRQLPKPY